MTGIQRWRHKVMLDWFGWLCRDIVRGEQWYIQRSLDAFRESVQLYIEAMA